MTNDNHQTTPQEVWEANNEEFHYEPPQKSPELWSSDEFTALYDRVIGKRVRWTCQKCSKPFSSLEKARSHVEKQHSENLLDRYTPEVDD